MHTTLLIISMCLLISTMIPFIRHDFWIFRVFEYPRLQKFVFNIALIVIILFFDYPNNTTSLIVFIFLIINLGYLSYLISPFTVLGKKQIVSASRQPDDSNLKLFIANVFQENRSSDDYLTLIDSCKPDVVLLVETNSWWQNAMRSLCDDYPYCISAPLENTYGMLFYAKYELTNDRVKYLVKNDIPSIETLIKLPNNQLVQLYCLHPEPPVPQENPRSTERDKEILLVGKKAKESEYPVIVMGDLNDVAWSYTTALFGKISGLLDPRRGRGFFNSFNAKYFFLRFPLDHIFCSADFTLSSIKRLHNCGSDHFPMCVNLQYNPMAEKTNEQPQASAADQKLADEKINAAV